MTDKARKNLEKCKMDCFNCPFPDCVLPYRIPDNAKEKLIENSEDKKINRGD